ncbi:WXG100 family type VII secretion target [Gordonia sp. zg691]|uniref:WXG100 family type VII secretion target n=1 Tax=Gordonia jinghuaiqii TaxID=2758710 RepID=A0A7D7R971_9ACTN|nr:WXG100 family type VII secretion target [Gordonia jinghuaiqii]MBD0860861.1 WXG100 family type VII secretion target [Gordonia jinghuaiqii]MCR5979578.1 WXG100 family type VII secretion target [Gordonia jinghuaiqii]QMT00630.1 WXG100 family type VII secretion target [Gordonia jinghuaiqii]
MTGSINYDFAALGDLSGGLRAAFTHLEDLNGQLKAQVAALDGNWNSQQAKGAYLEAQAAFDRIFMQSRDSLNQLEHGVSNASRIMQDTDSAIGSGFRSIV